MEILKDQEDYQHLEAYPTNAMNNALDIPSEKGNDGIPPNGNRKASNLSDSCAEVVQNLTEAFREGKKSLDINKSIVRYDSNVNEDQGSDDLEDGEIESDDEVGANNTTTITPAINDLNAQQSASSSTCVRKDHISLILQTSATGNENLNRESDNSSVVTAGSTFRRMEITEDDWAGNIELAIAAALKKDGIEPSLTKLDKRIATTNDLFENSSMIEGLRKNRKRKNKDEKEKSKMKRTKQIEPEVYPAKYQTDNLDDDEMVCVRGGSPILSNSMHNTMLAHPRCSPSSHSAMYESDDSYKSSYDSYDSAENRKMSFDDRRHDRRSRDRRHRGNNCQSNSGNTRSASIGNKRRNRHDSDGLCIMNVRGHCNDGEDCHRSHDARAPRKLELCKFYLMDCCAKKDKCSYMHADFPCKYYYLGMECIYKSDCKFSHGDPLTEQLRSILLKHIETAPKEILGNFRRISRENALNLILSTHARLCSEKGVENTFDAPSSSVSQSFLRKSKSPSDKIGLNTSSQSVRKRSESPSESRAGNPFASPAGWTATANDEDEENWDADEWSKPGSKNKMNNATFNISHSVTKSAEKQRKSRWRDTQSLPKSNSGISMQNAVASEILSLKNLKGVITPEQIERLEAIGIENLEQISQLTVAQLNNVGLTISQINEIQLNAMNIQKLGLISQDSKSEANEHSICIKVNSSVTHSSSPCNDDSQSIQDIDMRCLVGVVQASGTTRSILTPNALPESASALVASGEHSSQLEGSDVNSIEPIKNSTINEENTNTSVDFSQYLRDSNVKSVNRANFNDLLKDDKDEDETFNEDEPELLIDESRCTQSEDEQDIEKEEFNVHIVKNETIVFTSKGEDDDDWDCSKNAALGTDDGSRCCPMDYKLKEENANAFSELTPQYQFNASAHARWRENSGNDRVHIRCKQRLNPDSCQEKNKNHVWQEKTKTGWSNKSQSDKWLEDDRSNGNDAFNSQKESSSSKFVDNLNATSSSNVQSIFDDKKNVYHDSHSKGLSNEFRDPRLVNTHPAGLSFGVKLSIDNYSIDWDVNEEANVFKRKHSESSDTQVDVIPTVRREQSPPPKYQRTSIYDGSTIGDNKDNQSNRNAVQDVVQGFLADRDMRISSFSESGDIDLRLPFKPVMTNYTPATEIDGSVASHAPILYKVYEIIVPKPDYSEIRRTMTVTEKTLDPRLRRIFCLKESSNDSYTSDSDILRSPPTSGASIPHGAVSKLDAAEKNCGSVSLSGPRMDPRRRKDTFDLRNQTSPASKTTGSGAGSFGLGQNVDIRMLLQKSIWYKNLNSKYKIMVNQQLALVSTELKKFHNDVNPDKVFDMKFLATNQYLQQVLTNLGIFIDGNGQILQLESEVDDPLTGRPKGGQTMMLPSTGMLLEAVSPSGMAVDYMRPQQSNITALNPRFMAPNTIMNSFGTRFSGELCSGILGVPPQINSFAPFETSPGNQFSPGNYTATSISDDYANEQHHTGNNQFDQGDGASAKFYVGPDRSSGCNNRVNRTFRHNKIRNTANERWTGGITSNQGAGRSNIGRNRTFDSRTGSDGEPANNGRKGDTHANYLPKHPSPPAVPPTPVEEEECWD